MLKKKVENNRYVIIFENNVRNRRKRLFYFIF